jgi:hypothetical protein
LVERQQVLTKPIKNAKQLQQHIAAERAFWTAEVCNGNPFALDFPALLERASDEYERLLAAKTPDVADAFARLISILEKCNVGSGTRLAKIFKTHAGKKPEFWRGFSESVTNAKSDGAKGADWAAGAIAGAGYRAEIEQNYGIFEWNNPLRNRNK